MGTSWPEVKDPAGAEKTGVTWVVFSWTVRVKGIACTSGRKKRYAMLFPQLNPKAFMIRPSFSDSGRFPSESYAYPELMVSL